MKIGFLSLGCPKNLVDGEVMLGIARDAGHELTQDATDAEVLVVNTCAFIDRANQRRNRAYCLQLQLGRKNRQPWLLDAERPLRSTRDQSLEHIRVLIAGIGEQIAKIRGRR